MRPRPGSDLSRPRRRDPRSSARVAAVGLLVLAVAAGCGDGSSGGGDEAVGPTAVFSVQPEGGFLAFEAAPFPSDLFLFGDEDGAETIEIAGLEEVSPQFPEVLRQGFRTLDGFGLSTGVHFRFEGEIVPETLPRTPAESVLEGATAFLIEVEGGDVAPVRHPVEIGYDPAERLVTLLPRPGHPLRERTRYAAVITRGVQGVNPGTGQVGPVQPSFQMQVLLDPDAEVEGGGPLARAQSRYEDPLAILDALPDLERADIAALTVFTTQTGSRDLALVRQLLDREDPPRLRYDDPGLFYVYDSVAELDDLLGEAETESPGFGNPGGLAHGSIRAVLNAVFDGHGFKSHALGPADRALRGVHDDDRFVRGPDGVPVVQSFEAVPVTFVIPTAAEPADGYPVVIYQHGLSSERSAVFGVANTLAGAGYVVVAIEAAEHGMRYARTDVEVNLTGAAGADGFADPDPTQLAVGFFEAFLNVTAVRDNFRQTAVDLMELVRMLEDPDLDLSPVGSPRLDASHLVLLGQSLGSLMGAPFAAIEPDLPSAFLNVGGAGLFNYLLLESPDIGGSNLPTIAGLFGVGDPWQLDRFDPFVNLTQALLDAGDPIAYAHHFVRDPVAIRGRGRNAPKNLMLVEVMEDDVVPNVCTEHLAVAAGVDLATPRAAPVEGLDERPSVVVHNRIVDGVAVSAALVQQNPATHGGNLSSQVGHLRFVPGFRHDPSNPFPRLSEPVPVENPVRETQRAVVRFADTARAGRAEIAVTAPPDPFQR